MPSASTSHAPALAERERGVGLLKQAPEPPQSIRALAEEQPGLDVIPAKIRPPALRVGVIARIGLVSGLRREAPRVVNVVAPVGYGKTTLLAQWAAAEPRRVAWVSLDARDNDPYVLLKHVVAAVARVESLDRRVVDSLAGDRRRPWVRLVAAAARAVGAVRHPFLLVLDDVDVVRRREARDVLAMLIARAPLGSSVALASRTASGLPLAPLRAPGLVRDVGTDELTLCPEDADRLVRTANERLSDAEASELVGACEGWPAGLYLASLSLRDDPQRTRSGTIGGSDRYVVDYIREEYLSQLSPRARRFLRRTSILDELSGPLCDAVLEEGGSGAALRRLARGPRFLVSLRETAAAYRLPRLFRDVLQHELRAEEPQQVRRLHRRASAWYEANGDREAALEHARVAGDADRIATMLAQVALPASCRGRVGPVERAIAALDGPMQLERYPSVALHASLIHAYEGRTVEAERCLAIAERAARRGGRGAAALRAQIPVVRAGLCRSGPRRMLADAKTALAKLPPDSQWYSIAVHLHACAAMLCGATDEAIESLGEAAAAAEEAGLYRTQMIALSQRSLLMREAGEADGADALATAALAVGSKLDGDPALAVALAAGAHVSLRKRRPAEAAERVAAAGALAAPMTDSLPWLAVQTRLELARCSIALQDPNSAQSRLDEIDRVLSVRPELGDLVERADALRHDVAAAARPTLELGGLTPAELRLLPLLATHLSFREIADELGVSRNTVKTQAISIYRKLGVSGRSEAIAAAQLEPADPG